MQHSTITATAGDWILILDSNTDSIESLRSMATHLGCAYLATESPDEHDNYAMLSTEQWLAANNIAAASPTS